MTTNTTVIKRTLLLSVLVLALTTGILQYDRLTAYVHEAFKKGDVSTGAGDNVRAGTPLTSAMWNKIINTLADLTGEIMIDQNNHKVGIGTTNIDPASKLHVEGGLFVKTKTDTGELAVGKITLHNSTSGTGKFLTTNADGNAIWETPAASSWAEGTGNISYNGGNVGIGTTMPATNFKNALGVNVTAKLLDIQPGTTTPGGIVVGSVGRLGAGTEYRQGYFLRRNDAWNTAQAGMWKGSNTSGTEYWERLIINNDGGDPSIYFMQNLSPKMVISGSGNIGIGITNPSAQLSNTNSNILDQQQQGMAAGKSLRWEANESGYVIGANQLSTNGDANGILTKIEGTGTQRIFTANSAGIDRLVVLGNGNVGIGTTNPGAKLDTRTTTEQPMAYFQGKDLRTDPGNTDSSSYIFLKDEDSSQLWGLRVGNSGEFAIHQAAVSDRLFIANNGNVGIGTTTPTAKLETGSTGSSTYAFKFGNAIGNSFLTGYVDGDGDGGVSIGVGYASTDGPDNGLIVQGSVGIGTTSPSYLLHVNGTAAGTSWTNLSDVRLKKNIQNFSLNTIQDLEKIRPVSFAWKEPKDEIMQKLQFGLVAQEVEKVFPNLVSTAKDEIGTKSVNYDGFIPLLIAAFQELKKENEILKIQNSEILKQIKVLKK